jgi:N-acetylneuraminic acid mutarotase
MTRFPLALTLTVSTVAVTACGDEPMQPSIPGLTSPAPSFAIGSNTWAPKAALPVGPTGVATGMVYDASGNSVVYAIGGRIDGGSDFSVQAYSVTTNTWTRKTAGTNVFNTNGVGKIGSKLYFTGGYDYGSGLRLMVSQTWAYDYGADRMIRKADMPRPTADGVTGVISNKLYVLSGNCNDDNPPVFDCANDSVSRTLYRFDPVTNKWTTLGSAPRSHVNPAGGVINGKLYVAGGSDGVGRQTANLDVYDPATNKWKALAPLPTTSSSASGAVVNGKLLVVQWAYNNGSPAIHTYSYDPLTNKWSSKASPPNLGALARVALNGKSYVLSVGGTGSCCDSELPSQLYTP